MPVGHAKQRAIFGIDVPKGDHLGGPGRGRFWPQFMDEAVRGGDRVGSRRTRKSLRELQINDEALGNWVARRRDEHSVSERPLPLSEPARLAELECGNRQLRLASDFLERRDPSRRIAGERALCRDSGESWRRC